MDTLLLDRTAWDLVVDADGDIAVASNPYSLAQDAASAIKTFQGEAWYDTRLGVPYFQKILGKTPPLALIKQKFTDAAKTVPEVVAAVCFISAIASRRISGQVQVTDDAGVVLSAADFTT